MIESELILLGTDLDNEGKPIAYLARPEGRRGGLLYAGTAILTLAGNAREQLQDRIARLPSIKCAAVVPKVRQPEWVKPEIVVRVRHLKGGDTLRHASVQGLAAMYLIQLFLPLYNEKGAVVSEEHFAAVRSQLTEKFGGITIYSRAPAKGLWKDEGKVHKDDIVVFEVVAEQLDRQWWRGYRQTLEALFRQEEVL